MKNRQTYIHYGSKGLLSNATTIKDWNIWDIHCSLKWLIWDKLYLCDLRIFAFAWIKKFYFVQHFTTNFLVVFKHLNCYVFMFMFKRNILSRSCFDMCILYRWNASTAVTYLRLKHFKWKKNLRISFRHFREANGEYAFLSHTSPVYLVIRVQYIWSGETMLFPVKKSAKF